MRRALGGMVLFLAPALAYANAGAHSDPIASVILVVTGLLFCALIGRYLAHCTHQPAVLGELLMGVLIGNVGYFFAIPLFIVLREGAAIFPIMNELLSGHSLHDAVYAVIAQPLYAKPMIHALGSVQGNDYLKIAYILDIFSRYGVIFLLFMVGLESSVDELKHTGRESLLVAMLGVIAPMILGIAVSSVLIPEATFQAHLFVGATLSATSIGITARVLADMQKLRTREAHTILGAAMIDDVLGLILLAAVSSMIISGGVSGGALVAIIAAALLFFLAVLFVGPHFLKTGVRCFSFLPLWEAKLFTAFLFIMLLAWLASFVQLAAIIGAFAAGIVLHEQYLQGTVEQKEPHLSVHQLIAPLGALLAPLFFIVIGLQVKLEAFFNTQVLLLAGCLTFAAIVGKLLSGLGASNKDDRLLIGIGMLPRGEVGLVFASIGRTLGVVSDTLFSAIVLMVVITTFLAPMLLKARYARTNQ